MWFPSFHLSPSGRSPSASAHVHRNLVRQELRQYTCAYVKLTYNVMLFSRRDSELDKDVVNSVIYKWTFSPEGIPSFTEHQDVDASHATAVEIINFENDVFIAFSSAAYIGGKVTSQTISGVDVFKVREFFNVVMPFSNS